MPSRIVCILFALVSLLIVFNKQLYNKRIFEHDKAGYYIYLPAAFIYDDLDHLSFYEPTAQKYSLGGGTNFGIHKLPNGNRLNKYPLGCAVFNLPFFLFAHLYCATTNDWPADGYSPPYNLAVIFSTIFWVTSALFILRRLLKKYNSDHITALVILCLSFGTNLYYYTAFEPGMSHPYSFFTLSLILYCTDLWYDTGKRKYACIAGLSIGLATVIRPVNIFVLIIPLLWGVGNYPAFKSRTRLLLSKWKDIAFSAILCFAILLLQMAYWKCVTGGWIYYSYRGEGFDFAHPKIWQGLFGYRKGWFVYTPIALLAFIGLFFTPRKTSMAIMLFFALAIFITFSWENWYYGGSFGCRPLIDALALLSIPLAYLFTYIFSKTQKSVRYFSGTIIFFLVALNIFQSYQYGGAVIHWDRMTKEYYWRVFGKTRVDDSTKRLLLPEEEYYSEIEGWDK